MPDDDPTSLPEAARALLGRAALLRPDEPMDATMAQVLGFGEALEVLLQRGLITADGHLAPGIRVVAERLLSQDAEASRYQNTLREHRVLRVGVLPQPQLVRDYWTTDDHLGYRPYAQALASFIRHPGSRPPLTIGVKGRWGAGKTSLMRMVRAELDPPGEDGEPRPIALTRDSREKLAKRRWWRKRTTADTPVTNAEVLRSAGATTDPTKALDVEATGDWRATVWFNPWKYQNSEQVWAGLAHELITQITGRLRTGDRERFWLRMNLGRVDRLALRRRVYRLLIERLAPWAVAVALAGAVLGVLWLTGVLAGPARWLLAGGSGAALVAAVGFSAWFQKQRAAVGFGQLLSGPATAMTGEAKGLFDLVTDPAYTTKVGFLHAVHSDMERVLKLVATEDRPLVVFVDDLDRCSPGVVAQVIEAINLFLAGEFDNCVFVMAMEPDIVAAHVETAYAELAARVGGEGGELGWRFLEKIVQLPMGLPAIDTEAHLPGYLRGLLGVRAPAQTEPAAPVQTEVPSGPPVVGFAVAAGPVPVPRSIPDHELVEWAERSLRSTATLDTLDQEAAALVARLASGAILTLLSGPTQVPFARDRAQEIVRTAADRVHADLFARAYTDDQALGAIGAALPALGTPNPREIKRYVNLFRFYSFIVAARRSDVTAEQIAKIAGLAIRWPDLLTTLAREDVLAHLEQDDAWDTLRAAQPRLDALRAFLQQGPRISEAARLLL